MSNFPNKNVKTKWTDEKGNTVAQLDQMGNFYAESVNFADGTSQSTAASGGGGGGSAAPQIPLAGVASPTPAYSPVESPSTINPGFYVEDAAGLWHAQAGIDQNTHSNNPPVPIGVLTWTRMQWYRDSLIPLQNGNNAFMSINHIQGVNTSSANQDRALAINMCNLSAQILSFAINNNIVTLQLSTLISGFPVAEGSVPFQQGMAVIIEGLSIGTYLNGVVFNVVGAATPVGNDQVIQVSSSSFTHANVTTTADTGQIDQNIYSQAGIQIETDIIGTPQFQPDPDSELSTASFQQSDQHAGLAVAPPNNGIQALRLTYFREEGTGALCGTWGSVKPCVIRSQVQDNASNAHGNSLQQLINLYLQCTVAFTDCPDVYYAAYIDYPSEAMLGGSYGLLIKPYTGASDYAIYSEGGLCFFQGQIQTASSLQLGAFTVATLPAGTAGAIAYASNGRKVGEGSGSGTGVPVYYSNGEWRVYSTDAQVAA